MISQSRSTRVGETEWAVSVTGLQSTGQTEESEIDRESVGELRYVALESPGEEPKGFSPERSEPQAKQAKSTSQRLAAE